MPEGDLEALGKTRDFSLHISFEVKDNVNHTLLLRDNNPHFLQSAARLQRVKKTCCVYSAHGIIMGKASLDPWLADFLWEEIANVIAWTRHLKANKVKPDPDGRFNDDGSNFRSRNSDKEDAVQLILVLSTKKGAADVLLSDGQTSIKARLSEDVIATLEEETEEKFSHATTNDVFRLKDFTVISTPIGPSDSLVRLTVDKIEYEHHLRKAKGEPRPVQENEHIAQLIQDIEQIRQRELAPHTEKQSSNKEDTLPRQEEDSMRSATTIAVPRSSMPASRQPSQPSYDAQSKAQQLARARQRVPHSKSLAPTLAKDGIEVEIGINLERPVQATSASSLSRRSNVPASSAMDSSHLSREAQRAQFVSNARKVLEGTQKPMETPRSSEVVAETPAKAKTQKAVPLFDSPAHDELRFASQDNLEPDVLTQLGSSPPSAQPPLIPSNDAVPQSSKSKVVYGRRRIPADQRKLLDDRLSWYPALPGNRFPRPNVPIALLQKWDEANLTRTKASQAKRASNAQTEQAEDVSLSGDSMSTSDTSDDEELSASQWPPTPPPRRPSLPPDSSMGSRPGSSGDLEVAAPRALPLRKSPLNPARGSRQDLPLPYKHALPPKPVVTVDPSPAHDHDNSIQSMPSMQSREPHRSSLKRPRSEHEDPHSSPPKHLQSPDKMASSPPNVPRYSESRPHETPLVRSTPHSSHLPAWTTQNNNYTPRNAPQGPRASEDLYLSSPYRNQPMVGRIPSRMRDSYRPSHSSQQSNYAGASRRRPSQDGERHSSPLGGLPLDMHPQYSEPEDPAEMHRKARRQYMQSRKRCEWLRGRYIPDESGSFRFYDVLATYRASHPHDDEVLEESFANAVLEVFPEISIPQQSLFTKQLSPASKKAMADSAARQTDTNDQVAQSRRRNGAKDNQQPQQRRQKPPLPGISRQGMMAPIDPVNGMFKKKRNKGEK